MVATRILIYLGMTLFGIASLVTIYYLWESKVRADEQLKVKAAQVEQLARDQAAYIESMKILILRQDHILEELRKQKEDLEKKMGEITQYLDSKEAKDNDRESSKVLKETIKRLRGE